MDAKKKIYSKADFDNFTEAVKKECEQTLIRQRERILELKKSLADAERKNAQYESQKELIYKSITAAVKKADDIERVSLIKYNQEIAQLKSFHDKWIGYFNRIIEAYPLDDELVAASKVNGKIAQVLEKTGDIEQQYNAERDRLMTSLQAERADADPGVVAARSIAEKEASASLAANSDAADDYADRSPAGFSFAEALHPKDDLKDIMKELGIIMDE